MDRIAAHASSNGHLRQVPDEMFTIIKTATTSSGSSNIAPRLGRLALAGRRVINTPHYLSDTSRGVVPHITPDTFRRDTNIGAVYVALEDFIERSAESGPPIYKFHPPDEASPLRKFVALPDEAVLVLGARRSLPITAPAANPNTNTAVAVCTSVGFRQLHKDDYADAAESLQADIVVGLGDIPYGRALGNKRVEKATDRNIEWLQDHITLRDSSKSNVNGKLFASLLPVSCAKQQYYIDFLTRHYEHDVSGLAVFSLDPLEDLPESISKLPRLAFTTPSSPHDVLRHVSLGLDVFAIPFVGAATDAGIALDFTFPASATINNATPLPLGVDMWLPDHAVDLSPLTNGCECYACTHHHRAYVQHLLTAKEMLGWVLLQIHNHHTIDLFFKGIRQSIQADTLEHNTLVFRKVYDSHLPEKTGQGPRVRGYQYKAEGPGEPKRNAAPFSVLNDGAEKLAEATPPSADTDATTLQDQGFAEKE